MTDRRYRCRKYSKAFQFRGCVLNIPVHENTARLFNLGDASLTSPFTKIIVEIPTEHERASLFRVLPAREPRCLAYMKSQREVNEKCRRGLQ